MARLRLVFFGTGGLLSAASLRAVAVDHDVLGVVRAASGGWPRRLAGRVARRFGLIPADPLADAARAAGVAQWPVRSMRDRRLLDRLQALQPDLICVAHFPWRLPDEVLGAAALGGINVHASLLPRHRGPLPLFWVYHADDREAGVTVHHMAREFDRGDIILQQAIALPRGYPADALNADNARAGAGLLQRAVRALARGDAERRPQNEDLATRAPFVKPGQAMVGFETWDVERVWHFLAGVWPRFLEPLVDEQGRPASYRGVVGYERGPVRAAIGRTHPIDADRIGLACLGGTVILRAAVAASRPNGPTPSP